MPKDPRYLVVVTRRRFHFFQSVKIHGPFTYQKATTAALGARDTNPKTFVSASVHIAVRTFVGPGSVPGSLVFALQRKEA